MLRIQHYNINTNIKINFLVYKSLAYLSNIQNMVLMRKKIQTTKHLQCIECPIFKKCYPFPDLHSLFVHVTSNNRGSDDSIKLF